MPNYSLLGHLQAIMNREGQLPGELPLDVRQRCMARCAVRAFSPLGVVSRARKHRREQWAQPGREPVMAAGWRVGLGPMAYRRPALWRNLAEAVLCRSQSGAKRSSGQSGYRPYLAQDSCRILPYSGGAAAAAAGACSIWRHRAAAHAADRAGHRPRWPPRWPWVECKHFALPRCTAATCTAAAHRGGARRCHRRQWPVLRPHPAPNVAVCL